jgi:hypothetical protein
MAFTWNETQKAAKTAGELVFAMRQSQTDVMTMPGPWGAAYSGYCNGLAIKWLSLRRSNDNFDFDSKTLALEFPSWEATREQNIYEDHDDPTALAKQNLMLSGTKKTRTGSPSAEWMQQTIAAETGLYLVGFFRAGGGHGVAMESNLASGQFHYFDANYGHFVLKGATRFKAWLTKFLTDSGYQARYLTRTEFDLVKDKGIKKGSVSALKAKFGG